MRLPGRRAEGPLILVTDGWLANAGDAAIYQAMSRSLRAELPGARVAIACHHRALVGNRYPELDLVPPIDSLAGVRWPWTSEQDVADRETIERLVEAADLILVPGGGFLLERYRPEGRIRIYEELLARGKRLMFYAQSIGRFQDPELRARLAAVLAAAELVIVRDEPSLSVVLEQRRRDGVHLTADEAFLLRRRRRRRRRRPQPRSLLVTAAEHPWETAKGGSEIEKGHIESIAASLTRLLESGAVETICLASTTQGLGGPELALEDDAVASWAVRDAVPPSLQTRIERRTEYISASEYLELAARHSAVISMRMHGAILATVAGTPALLANASGKARSLSARTGNAIAGIAGIDDLARLDELVTPLLEAGDRPKGQEAALQQMRSLARRSSRLVAERIADQGSDPR